MKTFKKIQSGLYKARATAGISKSQGEAIPVVHDRERLIHQGDESMPRLVLSTFLEAGNLDFATCDVVIILEAETCIQDRAQRALETMDARFRVFGIIRHGQKLAPYESGVMMGVFGPELIDLMPQGRTRREVHVGWIPHNQPRTTIERTTSEFDYKCIFHNERRNRVIAGFAKKLTSGAPLFPECMSLLKTHLNLLDDQTPCVTILVDSVEHALALGEKLKDWPIVGGNDVDLYGLPGRYRSRLKRDKRRLITGEKQIVLTSAAGSLSATVSPDILIWAGAGSHPPALPASWLGQSRDTERPLLIFDFLDAFNRVTKKWQRRRKKQYEANDIFEVGVDPMIGRVRRFLREQPGGQE